MLHREAIQRRGLRVARVEGLRIRRPPLAALLVLAHFLIIFVLFGLSVNLTSYFIAFMASIIITREIWVGALRDLNARNGKLEATKVTFMGPSNFAAYCSALLLGFNSIEFDQKAKSFMKILLVNAKLKVICKKDKKLFRKAFKNFEATIKYQRKDGSIPIEVRRGGRAMFYQGRAMNALAVIAIICLLYTSDAADE